MGLGKILSPYSKSDRGWTSLKCVNIILRPEALQKLFEITLLKTFEPWMTGVDMFSPLRLLTLSFSSFLFIYRHSHLDHLNLSVTLRLTS